MVEKDYYKLLGIEKSATKEDNRKTNFSEPSLEALR